ncbi:MAG: hypothetical protein J0L64_28350 [Acidobacteria bacterium]|nr:hypothetical protein [Acidobacteriota bacterium]
MPAEDGTLLARDAALFLDQQKEAIGLPGLRIVMQEEFLREAAALPGLTRDERLTVLTQAEVVLKNLYAHLAFKKTDDPAANPFVAFAQIRDQIDTLSDFDFHTCMLIALAKVRDVHTSYLAPSPYQGAVAFLPFQIRFFEQPKGQFRFVVAKTMAASGDGTLGHEAFVIGAEIVSWNDLDPLEATRVAAEMQPGANLDAELSRGVARMTIRSIASHGVTGKGGAPPFQLSHHAVIRYIAPGEKRKREIVFPWQVATGFGATSFSSAAFSVSDALTLMQHWAKCSYRPDKLLKTSPPDHAAAAAPAAAAPTGADDWLEAQFATDPPRPGCPHPDLLRNDADPEYPLGYLRIRHFAGDAPALLEDAKLAQAADLLRRFDREARGGLILDIRGNPGGQIRLAERMLQLFSPGEIRPLSFHFPRTQLVTDVLAFFRAHAGSAGRFEEWIEARPGDETAAEHLTPGRTITPPAAANDTGQIYQGPVVLLLDALTYSAADMFAAGFQDHGIGELIGVDCSTGGGGADKWSYQDIVESLKPVPGFDLPDLPRDCRLTLAVRRCTRPGAGQQPIEDIGVTPHLFHARTERDVLDTNNDLFALACERLMMPLARIDVEAHQRDGGKLTLTVSAVGAAFIAFRLDGTVLASGPLTECHPHSFSMEIPEAQGESRQLRLEAYEHQAAFEAALAPLASPRLPLAAPPSRSNLGFLRTPPSARRKREAAAS